MKKTIITIVLLFVFMLSYGQIKMHPSGQISFKSTTTTNGIQIDTSGKTSFEPILTRDYISITRVLSYASRIKAWTIKYADTNLHPDEPFYVLGNGTVYGCSYYTFPPGGGGEPSRSSQPIINATDLLLSIGGYYFDNPEFVGFVPDYEDNPEVNPEAIEGLLKDIEIERMLGLNPNEIEAVLPEAIRHDPQGAICINYQALIPVLIEGFKEQQRTIESLQKQITNMKLESRGTNTIDEHQQNGNELYQNTPNPTNSSTTIDCYIDSNVSKAVIAVYDLNGLQLKEYPVYHQGKNTITIKENVFKPGMYLYSLLVDGKLIDTKRMVITSK
ncbi:MAG: T9SS type A sorting domain-containing protein [Bacteroidales bacterium]|nr:T9SS type A sorting domain-containing protein [Bacteroidales bacterium]